jgi:predicted Fe-Mo cluster-binding NifX family protein
MKVVVCSIGDKLDSPVDPRFGRCANFVVVNTETLETTAIPNPGVRAAQGAGIQAAQVVASLGAEAVIAGNYGPNAYHALSAGRLRVYTGAVGTVRQAAGQLTSGALQEVGAPTVAAHASMGAAPGDTAAPDAATGPGPGQILGGGGRGMGGGGGGRGMRRGGGGRGRGGSCPARGGRPSR